MSDTKQIVLDDVHKSFPIGGDLFEALKGISLTVKRGAFLGLVGPSGSGKTTLLNIIGGLDEPTSGTVTVGARNLAHLTDNDLADFRNETIGFVFQTFNLLPVYTAFENTQFPLLIHRGAKPGNDNELVEEILEKVGLKDKMHKMPGTLSGGECQRVAIARAMVKKPSIVLADEPTANLDAQNSHEVLKIMSRLNQDYGTTFLFSTHDEKVMQYLKRTIRLTDGRITDDRCSD